VRPARRSGYRIAPRYAERHVQEKRAAAAAAINYFSFRPLPPSTDFYKSYKRFTGS